MGPPRRFLAWAIPALILAAALGAAVTVALLVRLPRHDEFNVLAWEARHVPGKWLYLGGRFVNGRLSPAEEDERLARYLLLTQEVRRLEAAGAPAAEVEALVDERQRIENDVEAVIEGRITAVLEDESLESSLPLFPDARWVFPPVDVEFDEPPPVLALSPRDRIELLGTRPLRPGLTVEDAAAEERAAEASDDLSAVVLPLSGAATYPSIVRPSGDYRALVETAAHEWVHQYLFFRPLGIRFYESLDLRTMNETVATLAGEDLAALVVERYPLPPEAQAWLEANASRARPSTDAFLARLRVEVDALLARGEVDAAERLMEERRQQLAAGGVTFRRINQAFLAFRSVYTGDSAAVDPLEAKVEALRERAGTPGAFLRAAASLAGPDDLDRLLSGR